MNKSIQNELSRIVDLEHIFQNKATYTVTATKQENKDLSQRFDLSNINDLKADYKILAPHTSRGGYYLEGVLKVEVVQKCVVTFEPVYEKIDTHFSLHIVDQKYAQENPFDDEGEEDFEYSIQGKVDLGELTAQYLSLSLNPYPRSSKSIIENTPAHSSEKKNSFSVLEKLK